MAVLVLQEPATQPATQPGSRIAEPALRREVAALLELLPALVRPTEAQLKSTGDRVYAAVDRLERDFPAIAAQLLRNWSRDLLDRHFRATEALRAATRARALFARAGDEHTAALVDVERGVALFELKQFDESLRVFAGAAPVLRRLGDDETLSILVFNHGNVLLMRCQYPEALQAYAEAERVFRKLGNDEGTGKTAASRGNLYQATGQYDEALRAYADAEAVFRRLDSQEWLATIAANRGAIQESRGRYEEALRAYDEAERVFRSLGKHGVLSGIAINRGNLYRALGREDEALRAYEAGERTLASADGGGSPGSIALTRGHALASLGRHAEAADAYAAAERRFRAVGDESSVAAAVRGRGRVHWAMGKGEEALADYEDAERIARRIGDRSGVAAAVRDRASALAAAGRHEDALRAYDEADHLASALGDALSLASTAHNRARTLLALRRPEASLDTALGCARRLQHALGTQVQRLGQASSEAFRNQFAALVPTALAALVQIQAQRPEHRAAAYEVLQTLHALGTAELLAERGRLKSEQMPEDLRERHEAARVRYRAALVRRDQVTDAGEREAINRQLQSLAADLDQLVEAARLRSRAYVDVSYPIPATVAEVQAQLQAGVALIELQLHDRLGGWAFVTTRGSNFVVALADAGAIQEEARNLQAFLTAAGAPPPAVRLRSLGEKLLDPILDQLATEKIHTLLFAPHGELCRIPLDLLLTANAGKDAPSAEWPYLVRDFDVACVHSGTVLAALRQDARSRSQAAPALDFFGIGDPFDVAQEPGAADAAGSEVDASLRGHRQPIPGTAQEVIQAAYGFARSDAERAALQSAARTLAQDPHARLPALSGERFKVLLRLAANEPALKSDPLVRKARILHLACHGEADVESPRLSRLVLAQSPRIERKTGEDGYLYLQELRDLNLSCELLVLSACESNGRVLSLLEGMTGLARAGLAAGARAVVSTLWQVQDRVARDFMVRFYAGWGKGGVTRIQAFNRARREALQAGWPMAAWAAYVLWDAQVTPE